MHQVAPCRISCQTFCFPPRKLKIIWSVPDSCSWQSRFLWENIFPEKIKRRIEFFSVSVAGNPWLWQFVQLTACWKNIKIVRNTNLDFMWTARYFFEPLLLWRRLLLCCWGSDTFKRLDNLSSFHNLTIKISQSNINCNNWLRVRKTLDLKTEE